MLLLWSCWNGSSCCCCCCCCWCKSWTSWPTINPCPAWYRHKKYLEFYTFQSFDSFVTFWSIFKYSDSDFPHIPSHVHACLRLAISQKIFTERYRLFAKQRNLQTKNFDYKHFKLSLHIRFWHVFTALCCNF